MQLLAITSKFEPRADSVIAKVVRLYQDDQALAHGVFGSPLKHKNINVPGRYSFTASVLAAGSLRPPRDPDVPGVDDDDDDGEPE
ncbi:hypothetical protein ACFV16_02505 [Streptomyces massasporeus]|uniref:hypothetical protein n=1 Tax=Streptomyces massasporeus TaxID=67324 RepID=UPI0036A73A8B